MVQTPRRLSSSAPTPLTISICEWLCLGRELPGLRSTLCLVTLLLAAIAYVLTDAQFQVYGYVWVGVWYVIFCFDQLYIKYAVDSVEVESNWGRVFYTNLWACMIAGCIAGATEPATLRTFHWTWQSGGALAVSCALGVAMSYFAFLCRAQVSATHFTVIGNVCKLLTVLINVCIWDKHATPMGLGFLFLCLVAAFLYKPSPKRAPPPQLPEQEALVKEEEAMVDHSVREARAASTTQKMRDCIQAHMKREVMVRKRSTEVLVSSQWRARARADRADAAITAEDLLSHLLTSSYPTAREFRPRHPRRS